MPDTNTRMRTSQKRFWEVLAKTKGQWRLSRRAYLRTRAGYRCPIGEVCRLLTGQRRGVNPSYWQDNSRLIGLPTQFARTIARAADIADPYSLTAIEERSRKRLLKTVGLT